MAANKSAHEVYTNFIRPDAAEKLAPISATTLKKLQDVFEKRVSQSHILLSSDTFAEAQAEVLQGLRLHTYDKFVCSSYLNGIIELKEREKEVQHARSDATRHARKHARAQA